MSIAQTLKLVWKNNILRIVITFFFLLFQAKSFAGDLQDILSHMSELEGCLITSTPVGGLPETAREQLEKFMVHICGFFITSFTYYNIP